MNVIENCHEGGEGIVINNNPDVLLPYSEVRCSCASCPAALKCLRFKTYLKEVDTKPKEAITASFCGEVFTNAEKDCDYFISYE